MEQLNLSRTKDVILLAKFLLVYGREWKNAEWGGVTINEAIEAYARILEYDTALLKALSLPLAVKEKTNEKDSTINSNDGV